MILYAPRLRMHLFDLFFKIVCGSYFNDASLRVGIYISVYSRYNESTQVLLVCFHLIGALGFFEQNLFNYLKMF